MPKYLLLLCCVCFAACTYGQIQEKAAVDSIFHEWSQPNVPGGALGIIKEGKLIFAQGYGSADLEHNLPITSSSVFYIGSVSKQFVTFCILLLEEQGKLNLDDKIQDYLPDFPEYEKPLTIRHFIHHTSGVRDYLTLMDLKGRNYLDNIDPEEVYTLIKNQDELNFTPGEQYLYSNSCYFMLAMIVEQAAGESIKNFAHKNIFEPLGMTHTLFYDDNTDLIQNRVFSYEKKRNEAGFNNLIMRFDLVGSGGVYSSIEDLYLWDQNFYDNKLGKGGQDIINRMLEDGILNNGKSSGYAFALVNGTYRGLKTVGHTGSLAGYRAQLVRFPEQKFSVIILSNRDDGDPAGKSYEVADIMLKDQFKEQPPTAMGEEKNPNLDSSATLFTAQQLTGRYEMEPGFDAELFLKNDSLYMVQNWNQQEYAIAAKKGNLYEIPGEPATQFVFADLQDDATQTLIMYDRGKKIELKRKIKTDLSAVDLKDYTGNYYSKELDVSYRIFLEDGVLNAKVPNLPATELKFYDPDIFIYRGFIMRFTKSGETINSFEMDAGRVKNLKFTKEYESLENGK